MWFELGLTGAAALAAGGLSRRAARQWFLGAVEIDWLAGELELDRIDGDGMTVRTKDGLFVRAARLRGLAYEARVEREQEALLKGRAAFMNEVGMLGVGVHLFAVKRARDIGFEANWPAPALTEIGVAERRAFGASYAVDWYLMMVGREMRALVEATSRVRSLLAEYRPEMLARPEDAAGGCPLTGFLNGLVSGDYRRDLPAASVALSGSLPASDLHIERDSGVITAWTPEAWQYRIVAVREWPEAVSGRLAREVLALPGDIELAHICLPVDRDEAMLGFRRKGAEQRSLFIGNPALAVECEAMVDLLAEGHSTVFRTQMQILLRARSEEALEVLVGQTGRILGRLRIAYHVETAGAPLCWFARLPRRQRRGRPGGGLLRPLILREENIAALWPFASSPAGLRKSPFGALPVRYLPAPSGQAYAFQFHVSDEPQALGNFLLFAPTGAGKSTLMLYLLGGLAKFPGVRAYLFDSREGARFMVEALGGRYQGYEELALNPLDVGADGPANRQRVHAVLRAMVPPLDAAGEAALEHAVELAFKLEPPARTLDAIFPYAFERGSAIQRAMERWVTTAGGREGRNAHLFNAPRDSLGDFLAGSHLIAINMNEALDDPAVGPPVVAHIAAQISSTVAVGGRGFCIFIDEAAKLLQNQGFKTLAMEMYREHRKLNGVVGMAFQDPAALFSSGAAEAFLENTATLVFLPNSLATAESLEPFNLNTEQLGFILGGEYHEPRAGRREVLIVKRDAATGLDESAVVDVDLNRLPGCMRFFRAGAEANRDLAALKQRWGEQWPQHL